MLQVYFQIGIVTRASADMMSAHYILAFEFVGYLDICLCAVAMPRTHAMRGRNHAPHYSNAFALMCRSVIGWQHTLHSRTYTQQPA